MFGGKYHQWNQKKIQAIIDFFGLKFFHGKKILDLGCGYGDIGGSLMRLGSSVIAVDARQEYLKIAQRKFKGLKTVIADLDRQWQFNDQNFDIILDLGIACHLKDYKKHIKDICSSTSYLVLEMAVADGKDPSKCINVNESKNVYDLSFNGKGCRPTAAAVESVLEECGFSFKRLDNEIYNTNEISYSWNESDNDSPTAFEKRRMWFCIKDSVPLGFNYFNNIFVKDISQNNIYDVLTPSFEYEDKFLIKKDNKKLKVAVCLSGHLRIFEEAFSKLKEHLLDLYDCDIFIHTWDTMGLWMRGGDAPISRKKTNEQLAKIQNIAHPKKIIIEQYREFPVSQLMRQRSGEHRDLGGVQSMFYKIEQCNNLKSSYEKSNNMVYDAVVRIRPDIILEQDIIINQEDLNCINIPKYGDYSGLNDQLAFSSSKNMNIYSGIFSKLIRYLEVGAPMNPEKLIKFNIDLNKIPVKRPDISYYIKRPNGHILRNIDLERALRFR